MSHNFDSLGQVLEQFRLPPIPAEKITLLPAGLSGSQVWKVETAWGNFCLKCMPAGFSVQRIQTIHRAVTARRDAGMTLLPNYCQSASRQTYVEHDKRLWELQTWATGSEALPPYSFAEQRSMLQTVARFHQVLRNTPQDISRLAPSEGVATRLQMLRTWRDHRMQEVVPQVERYGNPKVRGILALFTMVFQTFHRPLELLLESVADEGFLVEYCIGDPRPENFHFEDGQVSAMFDFGSLRKDNIALDIARLASELSTDGSVDWELAFDNIELIRPLKEAEKHLTQILDAANVLLTGLKWVQWIVIDGYSFSNPKLVEARLLHLAMRVDQLIHHPVWQ
ncbi:aminoglycoside phosphotransferase family protein [Blastopirellula marina]|uniref:Aminoglycoside phosphotransferase domain-containing protein n=1 Tax=Blastopirellula marina TaxID=124 RepID=A0A2S8GD48_9BACT|nr:aminoglycoside phosphotransferase family protein [Blastopirellula marina]PQO42395.1 hypothetical protein C5Y93_29125 [Blastopirellula marina]